MVIYRVLPIYQQGHRFVFILQKMVSIFTNQHS